MSAVDVMPAAKDVEMEVDASADAQEEEDLYTRLKTLQRQLEFLEIHEEYIKTEQMNLKRELLRAQVRATGFFRASFIVFSA